MIDRRLRNTAVLVAACFFMEILDGTIVVTAIPQMSRSLDVPTSSTALVITAYWSPIKSGAIVLFVFVGNIATKPATTWLFNRFGFRTVLLAATGGLAATSVAAGLVTTGTPLFVIALFAFALLAAVALASLVDALRLHPSAGEALVDDRGSRRTAPATR